MNLNGNVCNTVGAVAVDNVYVAIFNAKMSFTLSSNAHFP